MNHYLINTTWRCQLRCPYCLLRWTKYDFAAVEHSWSEWAVALRDHTPPGSLFDFAGGEPLLFDGLPQLLAYLHQTGRRWAITTNALSTKGVDNLLRVRPEGCVLVNVSDHPGNNTDEMRANVDRLRAVYPLVHNRVAHPQAGHAYDGKINTVIPYQRWEDGTELDGIRRWCNSGTYHWVAEPGGNLFRCNPALALAEPPIGNLFRRTVGLPDPVICEHGCSSCYTGVRTAWPGEMRPL